MGKRRRLPPAWMQKLRTKQQDLCHYCAEALGGDSTFEHLKAVSRHPKDARKRRHLRAAHASCNSAVGCLPPDAKNRLAQFGRKHGRAAFIHAAKQQRRLQTAIENPAADYDMAFRVNPPEFLTWSIQKSI